MLRVDQDDVAGSSGEGIAQVVEGASCQAVTVGAMAATWAASPAVIATLAGNLGLGQIVDASGALGGVGAVFAGCRHGLAPGREVLPGITKLSGGLFTKFAR
jgi:hypothetical protein